MLWLNALHKTINAGRACVLVTVSEVQGSAPRAVGARMLVSADDVADTVGGGVLEQQVIERCRSILQNAAPDAAFETQTVVLGVDAKQCCGGKVTLQYEYHPACALNLVVFGAGHVAQSLALILQQLPCRAVFIDSRTEWLDKLPVSESGHGIITSQCLGNNAFLAVEQCPDNAYFLVMTHSHELDFDLIEAILSRGDSIYCGLIASKSKAARFRSRLTRKGFTDEELARLTAPIGEAHSVGKLPMEVAVATVCEVLKVRDQRHQLLCSSSSQPNTSSTPTLNSRAMRNALSKLGE